MNMKSTFLISGALALTLSAFGAETNGGSRPGEVVMVEINGTKVTLAEFERKRPTAFFQARNNFHDAQRKVVEDFIDEYLVEEQAKKQGMTAIAYMDKYVAEKMPKDPSDEALRVYFEGVDTKEPYEAVRGKIVDALRSRRSAKIRGEYVATLRAQAKVIFRVGPPRAEISMKDTPVRGATNAPVLLVEYADYECPYCQQIAPVLDKLEAEFKGKLAFAYKDMPLQMHANAPKAAEATHCAGAQGKYWEYHDLLSKTKMLDLASLKEGSQTLKLDTKAFEKCLDSGEKAGIVKAHMAEAQSLGVQGTPTFIVNGRFMSGTPTYEQLKALIEEELNFSTQQTAQR